MNKKELRAAIRNNKRQFTQQQLDELSFAVIEKLKKNKAFISARRILLYHSLPDEVNTHQLINEIKDKTILLPRVIDNENMVVCEYNGSDSVCEGAFRIMEPYGQAITDYSDIDLAIIPGMAFDSNGNRLGRGKGYYDRLLSKMPHIYKIGLCFPFQFVDSIPTESTDIGMDEVVC